MPMRENMVSAVRVSSIETPNPAATEPPWRSARPRSDTSAELAFAAAANRSATWVASVALRLKVLIAADWIAAAWAASSWPAVASCKVPRAASMACCAVMPPLASSSIALPASRAVTPARWVSSPSARAAILILFIPSAPEAVTPENALTVRSKSMPVEMALLKNPATAAPPATAARPPMKAPPTLLPMPPASAVKPLDEELIPCSAARSGLPRPAPAAAWLRRALPSSISARLASRAAAVSLRNARATRSLAASSRLPLAPACIASLSWRIATRACPPAFATLSRALACRSAACRVLLSAARSPSARPSPIFCPADLPALPSAVPVNTPRSSALIFFSAPLSVGITGKA